MTFCKERLTHTFVEDQQRRLVGIAIGIAIRWNYDTQVTQMFCKSYKVSYFSESGELSTNWLQIQPQDSGLTKVSGWNSNITEKSNSKERRNENRDEKARKTGFFLLIGSHWVIQLEFLVFASTPLDIIKPNLNQSFIIAAVDSILTPWIVFHWPHYVIHKRKQLW